MTVKQPFAPRRGGNKNITASTTSQAVSIGAGEKNLRIVCTAGGGNVHVYTYRASDATSVRNADTSDFPVMAGMASVITKDEQHDTVAVVADSGTPAVKLTPGEGW